MVETILSHLKEECKRNNLANVSEITMQKFAERHAKKITSDDLFTDDVKTDMITDLTIMNGQLYADNKLSAEKNKSDFESKIAEYQNKIAELEKNKKNPPKEDKADPVVLELKTQLETLQSKLDEKEKAETKQALINAIKNEYQSEDESLAKKFAKFVDNSNKIVDTEDAKTNFDRIKKEFEYFERADLDHRNVRRPSGLPKGFDKKKYDDIFVDKE